MKKEETEARKIFAEMYEVISGIPPTYTLENFDNLFWGDENVEKAQVHAIKFADKMIEELNNLRTNMKIDGTSDCFHNTELLRQYLEIKSIIKNFNINGKYPRK